MRIIESEHLLGTHWANWNMELPLKSIEIMLHDKMNIRMKLQLYQKDELSKMT